MVVQLAVVGLCKYKGFISAELVGSHRGKPILDPVGQDESGAAVSLELSAASALPAPTLVSR